MGRSTFNELGGETDSAGTHNETEELSFFFLNF